MSLDQAIVETIEEGYEDGSVERSTQAQMELLFSKYQLHECLRNYFRELGAESLFKEQQIPVGFGLNFLVQVALHKRAYIPTLVGILKKHFMEKDDVESRTAAQDCADAIDKAIQEGWALWDSESFQVVVNGGLDIPSSLQQQLNRFQYPLPMIEEPEQVHTNRQTGYQTIRGSLILKNNHHDEDICLDHINRANRIPLSINQDTVSFVQNRWKDLDRPKPDEDYEDYRKRVKAFVKYTNSSVDVIQALILQGNRIWITNKYDKRGRTYTQGYHANPQGNDWNKACIELADAEPLNQ